MLSWCTARSMARSCNRLVANSHASRIRLPRLTSLASAGAAAAALWSSGHVGNAKPMAAETVKTLEGCSKARRLQSYAPPARILVTGGTGAVGQYIVDDLVKHGYKVGVLDMAAPGREDVVHHAVDVLCLDAVVQAMAGYDAVVHAAGIPHPLNDPPKRVFDVNVNGTFNVMEAAAQLNITKVVFTSSESTLGFAFAAHRLAPLYIPVDESHPSRPQDPYGLSKVVSEQICKTYTEQFGIRTVCLRMPWVWKPEDAELPFYRSLIADYSDWYKNLWAFVDARDVATAHRLALEVELENTHEIFFITGPHNWTCRDGHVLMKQFWPEATRFATDFVGTDPLISHAKATRLLGYLPKFGVTDIIGHVQS